MKMGCQKRNNKKMNPHLKTIWLNARYWIVRRLVGPLARKAETLILKFEQGKVRFECSYISVLGCVFTHCLLRRAKFGFGFSPSGQKTIQAARHNLLPKPSIALCSLAK